MHLSPARRAQDVRDVCEIRMVPRVPRRVAPEDHVAFHEEQPRHRPGIAHGFADHIAFQRSARSSQPHPWSEHLALAALPDPEGGVEPLGRVGHGTGFLPVAPEEFLPLGDRALIDEQDRRIGGIGLADSA